MFKSLYFLANNLYLLDSGEYSTVGQGNCHRLFALQAVSAVALRTVFERLPGTFEDKVNQIKKNVHSLPNYRWKTELIESNFFIYFIFFLGGGDFVFTT